MINNQERFSDVFGRALSQADCSVSRAARISNKSRRTLENWLSGKVQRPRDPEAIKDVAQALRLSVADTNRLLQAAGHPATTPDNINLPEVLTEFVGRDTEVSRLAKLVTSKRQRLVTLFGIGGCGKTRLAIAVAQQSAHAFSDGVAFVSLTNINEPFEIWTRIAQTMGIPLTGAQSGVRDLADVLLAKKILLILDNFEQLSAYASQLETLLQYTRHLVLLVTSRVRLNLRTEMPIPLHGFIQPSSSQALFLQTARRRNVELYEPEGEQMQSIERLCHMLGDLPLAIELAAMWSDMFSPTEIEQKLRDNMSLLMRVNDGQFHLALESVLQYAWSQIDENGRQVALVFAISNTPYSTEAVLALSQGQPSSLRSLVDCGLLTRDQSGRFKVHELIQQYLARQLTTCSQLIQSTLFERHTAYYLDRFEDALSDYRKELDAKQLNEITLDWGHIQLAWAYAIEKEQFDRLSQIRTPFLYFETVDLWRDGLQFFQTKLENLSDVAPLLRANLLEGTIALSIRMNETERVLALGAECLTLFERYGAPNDGMSARIYLAGGMFFAGEVSKASGLLATVLTEAKRSGALYEEMLGTSLKAVMQMHLGQVDKSKKGYELILATVPPDSWMGLTMMVMYGLALQQSGDSTKAHAQWLAACQAERAPHTYMGWAAAEFLLQVHSPNNRADDLVSKMVQVGDEVGNVKNVARTLRHLMIHVPSFGKFDLMQQLMLTSLLLLHSHINTSDWLEDVFKSAQLCVATGQLESAELLLNAIASCRESPLDMKELAVGLLEKTLPDHVQPEVSSSISVLPELICQRLDALASLR